MRDLFHEWGSDLAVNSTGDVDLAAGSSAVNQRLSRRLLTNPGDYLWNLDYGGGLGQFIGTPVEPAEIEAVVRVQLGLEKAIAQTPAPQVSVEVADRANGYVVVNLKYFNLLSVPTRLRIAAS